MTMRRALLPLALIGLCLLLAFPALAEQTLHDAIAEQLGDERITDTLNHLRTGAAIAQGDKGTNLRGLQVLLNLLGADLTVDGSIGEMSITQLGKAQQAYGMPITDKVGQADYEEMMLNALIVKDPIAAGALLGPDYDNQIQYAQAARFELRGEYYSAYDKYITLGDYRDSASRATGCTQPWPANGPILRDSSYSAEDCQLTVRTTREPQQATYFKVYSGDVLVCGLFIIGTGEATVNLPKGTYTCKSGVGATWFGPKEAFGRGSDAFYQRLTFQDGADKATLRAGYRYTLILGDASENNVGTEYEDASTF